MMRVRRLFTRACPAPSRPSKHGGRDHLDVSRQEQPASPSKTRSGDASLASSLNVFPVSSAGRKVPPPATAKNAAPLALPLPAVLRQPEEQTDNWDDDFEEGISFSKLQGNRAVVNILRLITLNYSYTQHWKSRPLRRSASQNTMIMQRRSDRPAPHAQPQSVSSPNPHHAK